MGIKNLNNFLRTKCSKESLQEINLSELKHKKIAVDINNYIYKFASQNNSCELIMNVNIMLNIFIKYEIIPIFIFDGKPPDDKIPILQQKYKSKKNAMFELDILLQTFTNGDNTNAKHIIPQIKNKNRQIITITKEQIDDIKKMITHKGFTFYDAPYESDEICAMLNITEKVHACLSEDNDFIVYGCKCILKFFSLYKETIIQYNINNILKELNLTLSELKYICILCGTDYNIKNTDMEISHIFNLMLQYKQIQCSKTFYEWVKEENENFTFDITTLNNVFINNFNIDTIMHKDDILNSIVFKIPDIYTYHNDKDTLYVNKNNMSVINILAKYNCIVK